MGAQSLVIGKMFGEGFQFGKRKISAMPNEEFNALTFKDMMSNARDEMQASIPTMQLAMQDMKPMVETVVHEFINYLKLVTESARKEIVSTVVTPSGGVGAALGGPVLGPSLDEILAKITAAIQNEFLPSAGAVDMNTGIQLTDLSKPSTIPGLTIQEARDQAALKQRMYEHRQREKGKFAIAFAETVQPVAQISKRVVGKKAAGRSQRMERIKLIREINKPKSMGSFPGGSGSRAVRNSRKRRQQVAWVRQKQQLLVNLLARYRF